MAKKQQKVTLSKKTERIHLGGDEKRFQNVAMDDSKLGAAYNWYNYFYDYSDSKAFTLYWLKQQLASQKDTAKMQAVIDKLTTVKEYNFRVIGWICRLLTLGAKLPKRTLDFRNKQIAELVKKARTKDVEEESSKTGRTQEEKDRDQLCEIIGALDESIDNLFVKKSIEERFNVDAFFASKNLKAPQLEKIVDYYSRINSELVEAIKKPDEQLREAYSHLKKRELLELQQYVFDIMGSCRSVTDMKKLESLAKKPKKQRKVKAKSPEKIVSKLQYKKEDKAFSASSVDPATIVKSTQLWVFNTKTRMLISYIASGVDGLNIKGTTVLGYDEKLSIQKKLRRPDEVIPEVITGGKVTMRRLMENIKSKEGPVKGRINTDCLLLRVLK